jgi:hypothetical protein
MDSECTRTGESEKFTQWLHGFYCAINADPRIGVSHISLYMALFRQFSLNQFQNPVSIQRMDVMQLAKINGRATYHKCMRDLADYGYINYIPSLNPRSKSLVYLNQPGVK